MTHKNLIVWDLGATKCAAAKISFDTTTEKIHCEKTCAIKLREVNSLMELIEYIENTLDFRMKDADAICIGAAGIFDGEQLLLQAGYPYPMPIGILAKSLHWPPFHIIHDYAPIVCGTFICDVTDPQKVQCINQGDFNRHGRRIAIGVGTGLGGKDGVLFPDGDFWLGNNEVGHIGLSHSHAELINYLISVGEVEPNSLISFEKILSGAGTLRLHRFLHPECRSLSPEEMGEIIRSGKAMDTLALFAWYLGLFIGTIQLTFMPEGGIWITGGVIQNHFNVFEQKEFFEGIEATPAYLPQRKQLPIFVLKDPHHAFLGAAYYAVKKIMASESKK